MPKKISLIKNFNKLLLSVNTRIESFFNSIKILIDSKKKSKNKLVNIDKKILIGVGSIIIIILTYFSMPSFYNKNLVKIELKNQILEKYNLEVSFDGTLRYGLFPKPHYLIKDTVIIYDEDNLAKSDFAKIYISIKNLFLFERLKIKDLNFKKNEFDINSKNFIFFQKILNSNKSDYKINFSDSKLFYKDKYEDVIFLAKVKDLTSSYTDDFRQQLNAKFNIFNIPFKINIFNNLKKQNSIVNIESYKLRLKIKNNFEYNEENIDGLIDFKIMNETKKVNYNTNNNLLNFNTDKENFKGKIDFKPFYMTSDLNFHQIDIIKIFKNNSTFLNLLNTEILNNQSLNSVINIYSNKIKDINYLNNIGLKIYFEEGNIIIKNSSLDWRDSILINLDEVQLINQNDNIVFSGTISFDFRDIEDFYRQYQIKKTRRKMIKNIKLDFLLNINENKVELDNLNIDGFLNNNMNNFLNDFNFQKKNIFNKIIFRNSIKEFFNNL